MDVNAYEAQADTINVDDIATDSNNRIVMRRIKRNEAADDEVIAADDRELLFIQNQRECVGVGLEYCPEGANDMGWLGYFVGKNDHLHVLYIRHFTPTSGASVRDVVEPFFRGVNCNTSIRKIYFQMDANLLGGEVFTMLTPLFQNNYNLTTITINDCDFGDEGCRLFALAIGSSRHKSLQKLDLQDNNIPDEGMVDIITALSVHPHLEFLDLDGNRLSNNGCVALATLLIYSATELQRLYIACNEINDEGIDALVPALTNCSHLEQLHLHNNPSITTRGWQRLATILESSNSNLDCLDVDQNNVDDDAVDLFASALMNNHTLKTLNLDNNPSITLKGWQSFSKVLCNTSKVNTTFLSNHTLCDLGNGLNENEIIEPILDLNGRNDKKEVAMIKILQNHDDFDMLPFFEWEFKALPLAISWLERASAYEMPQGFEPNIEPRKLSTIYQFVRGMPVLYVENRLRKELEDIKVAESQLEEEELQEEFMQRKQLLQERKESIMRRLGGKLQRE